MKQRPHRVLSTRKLDPKNIIHINIRPNSKISSATNKSYLNRSINNSSIRIHSQRVSPIQTKIDNSANYHRIDPKKKKCSRLSIIIIVSMSILLVLIIIALSVILPIKLSTKHRKTPTSATLRWNKVGETVAGITSQLGTQPNQLSIPFDVAINYANTLYISDMNNNRIQRWFRGASSGTTVCGLQNGTHGSAANQLYSPGIVALDSDDGIYIADSQNSRIQFCTSNATNALTVAGNGSAGILNNQLNVPYGVSFDLSSRALYIADYVNQRIMCYAYGASSGTMVAGTGSGGNSFTQLDGPATVHFDSPTQSLIIVDVVYRRVVRWPLGATNWSLIAGDKTGVAGTNATQLNNPIGITMDPMGNFYVADYANTRIQLFLAGQFEGITIAGRTGVPGSNASLLMYPYSMKLDNQLNLYVADSGNHRIQRFLRY